MYVISVTCHVLFCLGNTLHFMGQSIHLFIHSFTLPRVQRQQ